MLNDFFCREDSELGIMSVQRKENDKHNWQLSWPEHGPIGLCVISWWFQLRSVSESSFDPLSFSEKNELLRKAIGQQCCRLQNEDPRLGSCRWLVEKVSGCVNATVFMWCVHVSLESFSLIGINVPLS